MKSFSTLAVSFLALAGSAFANPIAKRADASTFLPSVQELSTNVKGYTGSMNSTAASFSGLSLTDRPAALASISSDASSINDLVTAYTASIPSIESGAAASTKRDDASTEQLATELALLIGEINSSLNYAEAQTGEAFVVTKRQIAIIPLGSSLSALLVALDAVVDNLLALVKSIVDNLLLGLAGSLAGIVL